MSTALSLVPAAAVPAPLASIAAAFRSDEPTVGAMAVEDVTKLFNQLLSRAALLLGHKTWQDGAELYVLARSCAEMAQRRYRALKPGELVLAMDRGAAGEYKAKPDEVVYVQLPSVSAWLYAYQTTARHEAIKALRKAEEAAPVLLLAPPPRDYVAELLALIAQANAGKLPAAEKLDFANVLYEWLKAGGALAASCWPAGPPDYEAIRAEEAAALIEGPSPLNKTERRQRSTFIDILADGGAWPAGHPLARTVGNACKKRVLREWLLQCAAEETDVPALLARLNEAA